MKTELLKIAIASLHYRNYILENKVEVSNWNLATHIYNNPISYYEVKRIYFC